MPYSSGLCDCTQDIGTCVDVLCCTMCHVSHVTNALNFKPNECSCICPCWICCEIYATQDLMSLRFAPEPGLNSGCCRVMFCPLCVTCQTSRELTLRNMKPGGTCLSSGLTPNRPSALTPLELVQAIQSKQLSGMEVQ